MILKIGEGVFDVRLSARLLTTWMRWKLWPSYSNLQRLSREITTRQNHAREETP